VEPATFCRPPISAAEQDGHAGRPHRQRDRIGCCSSQAILDAAEPKLPHLRFHDLRHSAVSLLIAAGVELVEVSMLLGHSELRVTADLYSHLQKQTVAKAAKVMDAVFGR
jgi:integrase